MKTGTVEAQERVGQGPGWCQAQGGLAGERRIGLAEKRSCRMVIRYFGTARVNVPPYAKAEQMDLYGRMSGLHVLPREALVLQALPPIRKLRRQVGRRLGLRLRRRRRQTRRMA